jgi:hypothetical protein
MGLEETIERVAREKREGAARLPLLDANVWLGRPDLFPLAEELPRAAVGKAFAEYGIRGGLVSHWDSFRLSPQEGNQALLDAQGALPENTWLLWTGLPLVPREQDPLPGFGKPHARVRGVRLFPKTHHFTLSPWVVGSLCEWCVAHRLPLFLWHVEIEWDAVHALAGAFPELRIVLETQWQKILYHNRDLFSLLEARGNIRVESSNLIGQDFVSYLVKHWGAERLLFGSFLPMNDPWASIGMILDADITPEEKAMAAGGALRKLIDEVTP